jgi:hypothetical protein
VVSAALLAVDLIADSAATSTYVGRGVAIPRKG